MTFQLPQRVGEPPTIGQQPPQLQYSDLSPDHIKQQLWKWAFTSFPNTREHPTLVSVPTSRAMWLDENITPAHPDAFMPPPGSREFLHFHEDGSMHAVVDTECEDAILHSGWGVRHMYYDRGVKEMLVYGPRDENELAIVKTVVERSYRYAHG